MQMNCTTKELISFLHINKSAKVRISVFESTRNTLYKLSAISDNRLLICFEQMFHVKC